MACFLAVAPARAALAIGVSVNGGYGAVSFSYFHDQLAPAGVWFHSARWGEVWRPTHVEAHFHPYVHGHWVLTNDYGWMWVSAYGWSDIPFHYGRWVFDIDSGWIWIPGYVWAPSWVVWRTGGSVIGWAPMPPNAAFLAGTFYIGDTWYDDDYFGYPAWYGDAFVPATYASLFVFVGSDHFADNDFDGHMITGAAVTPLMSQTHNVVNMSVVNGHIFNHGIYPSVVARATGRPVQTVAAARVIRDPAHVADVRTGMRITAQERRTVPAAPAARALRQFKAEGVSPNLRNAWARTQNRETFGHADTGPSRAPSSARLGASERGQPAQFSSRATHEGAAGRYAGRSAVYSGSSRHAEATVPRERVSRSAYGRAERGSSWSRSTAERHASYARPARESYGAPFERGAYAPHYGNAPMMEHGGRMPAERGNVSPHGGGQPQGHPAPQRGGREPHGG
jgi:hypothetical protein